MKTTNWKPWTWGGLMLLHIVAGLSVAHGQAVALSLRLDTNQVAIGGATTLHIFAQVVPGLRTNADRIFAWYVDVLNTNGPSAQAAYASMLKPTSDKDPQTSSIGFDQGANRRGIYDTFLNLPGAGVSSPVELMSIPVTGLAVGRTRFLVTAGTGVPQLSTDFLVFLKDGSPPGIGGDYSAAAADLQVGGGVCQVPLQIASLGGNRFQLTFPPCPGRSHFVESTTGLASPGVWQSLPGAPHNSGSVNVTNTGPNTFFRVRVQ